MKLKLYPFAVSLVVCFGASDRLLAQYPGPAANRNGLGGYAGGAPLVTNYGGNRIGQGGYAGTAVGSTGIGSNRNGLGGWAASNAPPPGTGLMYYPSAGGTGTQGPRPVTYFSFRSDPPPPSRNEFLPTPALRINPLQLGR
jgi:hypothetical protein